MKIRYVLIASLICLIFAIYSAGRNAATAEQLAGAVVAADNANQPTDSAKTALANYVHGHMGTSLSVFLAAGYQRATTAAAPATSDGQIYHDAQTACAGHTSSVNQAGCVQNYINTHQPAGTPKPAAPAVDKSAYTLSYQSPPWTPDFTGFLIMAAVAGLALAGWLWLTRRW